MSFEAHRLEPNGQHTRDDVVGLYVLPFGADMQNSGDRLQTMVDAVGFPVVAADLVLQKQRVIFDMSARDANQIVGPNYRTMSQRRAEFFMSATQQDASAVKIGIGDSLGVPVVQGMQLHGEQQPFDAMLLRDGWNLDQKGNRIVGGMARYVGYLARDKAQEMKRNKPLHITYDTWSNTPDTKPDETNIAQKMLNVSDLMRGRENRDNALVLARAAGERAFAMNVVVFKNGLSGNHDQQADFISDLRNQVGDTSRFNVSRVDGWHSDLLDPARGANDVNATLELLA